MTERPPRRPTLIVPAKSRVAIVPGGDFASSNRLRAGGEISDTEPKDAHRAASHSIRRRDNKRLIFCIKEGRP